MSRSHWLAVLGLCLPALLFCTSALMSGGLGWWVLLILPLWAALAIISQGLGLYAQLLRAVGELSVQLDQLMPVQLHPVSHDEHRAALREFQLRTDGSDAKPIPELNNEVDVRLLIVESKGGPELGGLKAFSGGGFACLLLHQHVHTLTGIGHFQVLHELGHTAKGAIAANMHFPLRVIGVSSAVATLMLAEWTPAVVGLTALWVALLHIWTHKMTKTARIADELGADAFALRVATPRWFTRGSLEAYADRLFCDCSEHERSLRKAAFHKILRDGQPDWNLGFEIVQPLWFRMVAVSTVLICIYASVLAGLNAADVSWFRTGAFVFFSVAATLFMTGFCLAIHAASERVQWLLGATPKVPPEFSATLLAKFNIPLVSHSVLVRKTDSAVPAGGG